MPPSRPSATALPPTRPRRGAAAAGLAIAVAVHLGVALGLRSMDLSRVGTRNEVVEMEVQEPPPLPPPEPRPPEPEPPKPEPARPRLARHAPPTPASPPPPNETPPPEPPKQTAPPVFGISMSSVAAGDSAMAVPVGNTLMTKDRHRGPVTGPVAEASAPEHPPALEPVPETSLAEMPVLVFSVDSNNIYPPEARKLGLEGKVVMRVVIDETGRVRSVRLVGRAGNGFDEAAEKAMWKAKFKPGKTSDGKAVPTTITYTYSFLTS